ncbi:MAG: hypothetical protein FWG67_00880 [Defluviitaleaceae bacterium]|nr:hypothetical protein [Defluviitaleaceae bacterium]
MDKKAFLDEQIIEMMNEVEQPEEKAAVDEVVSEEVKPEDRTIYTGLKIMGKWVYFEERLLVADKLIMMVPEAFTQMGEAQAKMKYPSEQRPETILTDSSSAINLMFTYMDQAIKDEEVETFRDELMRGMQRLNPGIKPQERGVEVVGKKQVAYVEFTNPVLDGKLYNLLYFMELDGQCLMVNFNCRTKEMKYWKKAAFEMMASLRIVGEADERKGEFNESH